jgi:uncharacterized membrane protein
VHLIPDAVGRVLERPQDTPAAAYDAGMGLVLAVFALVLMAGAFGAVLVRRFRDGADGR